MSQVQILLSRWMFRGGRPDDPVASPERDSGGTYGHTVRTGRVRVGTPRPKNQNRGNCNLSISVIMPDCPSGEAGSTPAGCVTQEE